MSSHLCHQRAHSFRKKGQFYSRKVGYTAKHKGMSSLLEEAAKVVWEDTQDDLKLSTGNEANSSYFLPSGVNAHYSYNCIDQSSCPPNLLRRYSYRINAPDRVNPLTVKINPMRKCLVELVTQITKAMSKESDVWAKWLTKHPFNAITTKTYFSYNRNGNRIGKKTGWHPDQLYNYKTRQPRKGGDLVAGAPIALITFGDPKNLWFQRCRNGKPLRGQKLHIPQKSGTLFVLDGRDEEPDEEGCNWKHMANMNDSSGDAVTITFVLRCLESWECVHPDGALAFPKLSPTDTAKLDRAEKQGIQSTQEHCDKRWNLEIRIAWFLCLRKHSQERQEKQRLQRLARNKRRRELRKLKHSV